MITPVFEINQSDGFIIVIINAPFANVSVLICKPVLCAVCELELDEGHLEYRMQRMHRMQRIWRYRDGGVNCARHTAPPQATAPLLQ